MNRKMRHTALSLILLSRVFAGEPAVDASAIEKPSTTSSASGLLLGKLSGKSDFDRAWSAFTLYKDESNPILQEFSLQGRLQLQAADGQAESGHFGTDQLSDELLLGNNIEVRAARFGFKSRWFHLYKLGGQIDIDPDLQPSIYRGIFDLYLTYAPSDAFQLSVGKIKVMFSREQEISAREILTFERGLLANMLYPDELTGVWINGKGLNKHWLYEFGIYGNERNIEFSEFDGGEIMLAKIGYDYASHVGWDQAVVGIHFMHNSEPNFTGDKPIPASAKKFKSPNFSNSFALTNDITEERFRLISEFLYAQGEGKQSNVAGITIIPALYILDDLQVVGRFQYATSAEANGLMLPVRYESLAPDVGDKLGDQYVSTYLGLNYYIYGHKLKLMAGIEYSVMDGGSAGGDYDGYTVMGGLRFSF